LFEAKLNKSFEQTTEARSFANELLGASLTVSSIESKPSKRSPKAPFITSTLQQEASQKLGFSVKRTMSIAQNLYREGAITYMRTDSLHLSEEAISTAKEVILANYGSEFTMKRGIKQAPPAHKRLTKRFALLI
jgi:DNA topoisomerase-1